VKLTRREAIAAGAGAILLPGFEIDRLPRPSAGWATWREVAETLTSFERGAILTMFKRWPTWLHYVSVIQWNPEVGIFYGVGHPAQTAKDLGSVARFFLNAEIPILGEASTDDDRVWAVVGPLRLSAGLQAEFAADRERHGLKPFRQDADWQRSLKR
jgi:hypothetical protein